MRQILKNVLNLFLILLIAAVGYSGQNSKISQHLYKDIQKRGEHTEVAAWIYFKDKGSDLDQKIEQARHSFSPRTQLRRWRHRHIYPTADAFDVPVSEDYVKQLEGYVIRIRHRSRWLNAVSVETEGANIARIAGLPFVKKIDKVRTFIFKEPVEEEFKIGIESLRPAPAHIYDYGPSLGQVQQINVPALHDKGYSGKDVLMCFLDSGFNNLNHESLISLNILDTWDFINQDSDVSDQPGQIGNGDHGTNTLSTAAGFMPGKLIGPAFGADFILGKTENTEWERHIEEDDWVAGAEWADSLGADIISSSVGYREDFTNGEQDYTWEDMDGQTTIVTKGAVIAASRGILIVNSAGNEGNVSPPENTLIGPADASTVLAVGAVNPSGQRTDFSSVGPTADGRIKPDVMAQGSSVYAAEVSGVSIYGYMDGTSFSCPLVAGTAAILLEAHPDWTNLDIMEALKMTANNSSDPNNKIGWGVIDALAASEYVFKKVYAPQDFSVIRLEDNYAFFIQYVDRLSWKANPANQDNIQYYALSARRLADENAEFVQIAELDAQTLVYDNRGLLGSETFLYKLVAVDMDGKESNPVYARQ
jgi:hypothetical protein